MNIVTTLDSGWEVAERLAPGHDLLWANGGERDWIDARVPGHVHLDLMRAGALTDPFVRLHERGARWVDETDWTYRVRFDVDAERVAACGEFGRHYLDFDGIDTIARVFLNGELVGSVENMFFEHRFDVTEKLRAGGNELRVEFDSALVAGQTRAAKYLGDGATERGKQTYFNFPPRAFVRKAQYMFGWDWGPELVSCGLWKPVRLVTIPDAEIVDWRLEYDFVDAHTVDMHIWLTVDKHAPGPMMAGCALYAPGDNTPSMALPDAPGRHTIELFIEDQDVVRWSPNGGGGVQKRYLLNLRLWHPDDESDDGIEAFVDHKGVSVGFRTIELARTPDPDGAGEGFGFVVNGVPTFMKGANWIPDGSFPGSITDAQLRRRLTQARDAGFNMLRVWGGGLYESESFYALCDELGILVWQDFAFACSMYPDDLPGFVENVRAEATAAVRRLRHRACLALWCGGNENVELFQNRWSGADQATRFFGANTIYELLPKVLAAEDSRTPYWPNSPYSGDPEKPCQSPDFGDAHYWGAWHNHAGSDGDWTNYARNDCRFSSEFGFAAPCGTAAWELCTTPEDRAPDSAIIRAHDKTRKPLPVELAYIEKHFPIVVSFDDFIHYGQANQAMAMRFAVEHWRRRKGRCAGILFWQLNDCWPTQSWAVIDSAEAPKLAYHAIRRAYAPLLLSVHRNGDQLDTHLVNDTIDAIPGKLTVAIRSSTGETLTQNSIGTTAPANAATDGPALTLPLPDDLDASTAFIDASLTAPDGALLARSLSLLVEPKDLKLPAPSVSWKLTPTGETTADLTLTATHFAPFVWLYAWREDSSVTYSDNGFHLPPGEPYTIQLGGLTKTQLADPAAWLKIRHLAQNDAPTTND